MGYYSSKRRASRLKRLITWGAVITLLLWGVWQFAAVRQTILADARRFSGDDLPASRPGASLPIQEEQEPEVEVDPTGRGLGGLPSQDLKVRPRRPAGGGIAHAQRPADVVFPPVAPALAPEDRARRIEGLLAGANAAFDGGQFVSCRETLNEALVLLDATPREPAARTAETAGRDRDRAEQVRRQLAGLNDSVFLAGALFPEDPRAKLVDIQPGDSFLKLARRYRVPEPFLLQINPSLDPRRLKPATGVKIVPGPFNLRLVKADRRLDLFARDMYVGSFPATVEEGDYLPAGLYRVSRNGKIQQASAVWIGFEGIDEAARDVRRAWLYGTPGPRSGSDGQSSGARMADADLRRLYNVLVEGDSVLRVDP